MATLTELAPTSSSAVTCGEAVVGTSDGSEGIAEKCGSPDPWRTLLSLREHPLG